MEFEDVLEASKGLVREEMGWSEECPEVDAIDLAMNALRVLLANPEASFADVVREHYSDSGVDEIKAWWSGWGK
ncbi:hypothetical protein [Streptomyces alboflavus]|uniref:hypothetical protein n=1 Tax=Streptomyces alboflavus TaxID=67267 RepID=UPI000F65859D|nr:hypothetical protein [Streptomyces alboflavus]